MKSVTQLVAVSLLGVSLAALTGCSAPAPTLPSGDGSDDPSSGDSAQTGKLPPKTSSNTTNNTAGTSTPAPAPAPVTPAPVTPTTPPVTPPNPADPNGDPMVCMDQCAATGPAAQYWSCSANCQDQACDDKCWNPTCGQNEQACESALDTCATQCGLDMGGGGGMPGMPGMPGAP